nr:MAG: ORF1 [TTV-like mini virus]
MPPFNFYRRRWYPNRWRRRKRYFRRRRFGPTLRRRFRRRRWVRRRRFTRKYKRKLPNLRLKVWQPQTIKKCHIKGNLCAFACGRGRINHNFILTQESYVPTSEPGGGSWSILQFTTRVLYDEFKAGRNWWTCSNTGLPLTRYIRCKLKFYRSTETDYLVTISRTGPFEVSLDSYLATQPTRHLMNHRAIIIPKLGRGPNKKTYIKKYVSPPTLLQNKWYFSQDLYNTPLFMLTISACELDQMFAPEDQISTNITLYSLNTNAIQTANWEREPYDTKSAGTYNIYLWSHGNGQQPKTWKDLTFLGNCKQYTKGQPLSTNEEAVSIASTAQKNKWGNPFTHWFHHKDITIYYGALPTNTNKDETPNILPLTSLFVECRYNPFKDKGTGNKVYIVPTDTGNGSFLSIPTNLKLIIENLPLWIIFWGWGDWLLKSRPVAHIQEEWQVVVQSPYIYPKLPCYVFTDKYFRNPPEGDVWQTELTETDKAHWHIKYEMQMEQLELIAKTGPAAPKLNHTKQIEAHFNYDFYFKWGGNPAPMETITDPGEQDKFPTPYNKLQGLEIESPGKPKQHFLYTFDERRNEISLKTAKRLKTDFTTPTFFTDFGAKDIPWKEKTEDEDSSEEEEVQTPLQRQEQLILHLKRKRHQYRQRIQQLLKTKKLFPL